MAESTRVLLSYGVPPILSLESGRLLSVYYFVVFPLL
jgi:hypothetical protein